MRVINRLACESEVTDNWDTLVIVGPEGSGRRNLVEVTIENREGSPATVIVNGEQVIKAIQNAMNR